MSAQQKIKFPDGWGGKRKGAGRPAQGRRPSERHQIRPMLRASEPVHVTLRVADDVASLRRRDLYRAIRWATISVAKRESLRIVHISIQYDHIHLICEAADRICLARGIQGFAVSAARHINTAISKRRKCRRRGAVFPDRYHGRILKSPTSVKNALRYVLNNWRHHGEHARPFARTWLVDPFSSGISFCGWKELEGSHQMWRPPRMYEPLWTWLPKTWLLAEGWLRTGTISARDVPGAN